MVTYAIIGALLAWIIVDSVLAYQGRKLRQEYRSKTEIKGD